MRLLRKIAMSSAAVLLVTVGMVVPSAPANADIIGAFQLRARHSGMCLEVAGGSTGNGALILQAPCSNALNQLWNMRRPCGTNCYVQWINLGSGKCLDYLSAPNRVNGSWMMQWDCQFDTGDSQRFQVLKIGTLSTKDLYQIRGVCCPGFYLTVDGGSLAVGAHAVASNYPGDTAFYAQFTLA